MKEETIPQAGAGGKKTTQLSKHVEALFLKAQESLRTQNYEYAIELLINALDFAPESREIRQTLRRAEIDRSRQSGGGPLKLVEGAVRSLPAFVGLALAQMKKDSLQICDQCERILRYLPENRTVLKLLADGLIACKFEESAVDVLEAVSRMDRNSVDVLRKLGALYESTGRIAEGLRCYETLLKLKPHDAEAEHGYKNLVARKTMETGKWENTETFRDKIKDTEEARVLEKEEQLSSGTGEAQDVIRFNEKKLTERPDDLPTIKKLAELYLKDGRLDEAIALLVRAVQINSKDPYFAHALLQARSRKLDGEIQALEKMRAGGEASAAGKIAELARQKLAMETEEYRKMVAQYPTDLGMKFRLGLLLQSAGKFDEAIGMFQKSIMSPDLAVDASMHLAECFFKQKMFDLALEFYMKAAEKLSAFDDNDERRKNVNYRIGEVYEQLGQHEKALEKFKQIYAVDIDYRDIKTKITRRG